MSRTNKQGIARSKRLQKSSERSIWQFKKCCKLTFEQAKYMGVIESRNVPEGQEPIEGDYYFRKRRKLNWVTRKKYNRNGLDYYGIKHRFKSCKNY